MAGSHHMSYIIICQGIDKVLPISLLEEHCAMIFSEPQEYLKMFVILHFK